MQLNEAVIRLNPADPVGVAKIDLAEGMNLEQEEYRLVVRQVVPNGHKIALRAVSAGEVVRKYGQVIGVARCDIQPGEHVHTHNLGMASFERKTAFGSEARPASPLPAGEGRTFRGYLRRDGRAGTRNHVAVISTVNCSAHGAGDRPVFYTRKAGGVSERGWCDGFHPSVRLRGGYRWHKLPAITAHAGRDCHAPKRGRGCAGGAGL